MACAAKAEMSLSEANAVTAWNRRTEIENEALRDLAKNLKNMVETRDAWILQLEQVVEAFEEAAVGICSFCDHNPNACSGGDDRDDCPDDLCWTLSKGFTESGEDGDNK